MKNNGRTSSNCTLHTLHVQFVCRRSKVQIFIIIIIMIGIIIIIIAIVVIIVSVIGIIIMSSLCGGLQCSAQATKSFRLPFFASA